MGSKVNPNGLRFGVNKNWLSRWIASSNKQTATWIIQDDKIRTYLTSKYKSAQINNVEIERKQNSINVIISAAAPAVLMGTEESELKSIKLAINKIVGRNTKVVVNINNIQNPDLCARLIAREIADAIENRISFRNAQKFGMRKVMKAGAKGVKTHVSGRLGGVEMAREEGYSQGQMTLSTLRSDIDYALEEAHTTYGIIGVKVWINRGEIFNKSKSKKPDSNKKTNSNKKPFGLNSKKEASNSKTPSRTKKQSLNSNN